MNGPYRFGKDPLKRVVNQWVLLDNVEDMADVIEADNDETLQHVNQIAANQQDQRVTTTQPPPYAFEEQESTDSAVERRNKQYADWKTTADPFFRPPGQEMPLDCDLIEGKWVRKSNLAVDGRTYGKNACQERYGALKLPPKSVVRDLHDTLRGILSTFIEPWFCKERNEYCFRVTWFTEGRMQNFIYFFIYFPRSRLFIDHDLNRSMVILKNPFPIIITLCLSPDEKEVKEKADKEAAEKEAAEAAEKEEETEDKVEEPVPSTSAKSTLKKSTRASNKWTETLVKTLLERHIVSFYGGSLGIFVKSDTHEDAIWVTPCLDIEGTVSKEIEDTNSMQLIWRQDLDLKTDYTDSFRYNLTGRRKDNYNGGEQKAAKVKAEKNGEKAPRHKKKKEDDSDEKAPTKEKKKHKRKSTNKMDPQKSSQILESISSIVGKVTVTGKPAMTSTPIKNPPGSVVREEEMEEVEIEKGANEEDEKDEGDGQNNAARIIGDSEDEIDHQSPDGNIMPVDPNDGGRTPEIDQAFSKETLPQETQVKQEILVEGEMCVDHTACYNHLNEVSVQLNGQLEEFRSLRSKIKKDNKSFKEKVHAKIEAGLQATDTRFVDYLALNKQNTDAINNELLDVIRRLENGPARKSRRATTADLVKSVTADPSEATVSSAKRAKPEPTPVKSPLPLPGPSGGDQPLEIPGPKKRVNVYKNDEEKDQLSQKHNPHLSTTPVPGEITITSKRRTFKFSDFFTEDMRQTIKGCAKTATTQHPDRYGRAQYAFKVGCDLLASSKHFMATYGLEIMRDGLKRAIFLCKKISPTDEQMEVLCVLPWITGLYEYICGILKEDPETHSIFTKGPKKKHNSKNVRLTFRDWIKHAKADLDTQVKRMYKRIKEEEDELEKQLAVAKRVKKRSAKHRKVEDESSKKVEGEASNGIGSDGKRRMDKRGKQPIEYITDKGVHTFKYRDYTKMTPDDYRFDLIKAHVEIDTSDNDEDTDYPNLSMEAQQPLAKAPPKKKAKTEKSVEKAVVLDPQSSKEDDEDDGNDADFTITATPRTLRQRKQPENSKGDEPQAASGISIEVKDEIPDSDGSVKSHTAERSSYESGSGSEVYDSASSSEDDSSSEDKPMKRKTVKAKVKTKD